jgi:hypothetical protein
MFAQLLNTTLRILLFRAGPQDFPYDPGRNLTIICVLFAVATNTLAISLILPLGGAFAAAAMNIALLAVFTRVSLSLRKLDSRFQQTFNSLLLTNGALTLVMLPFFAQVAPAWLALSDLIRENPDLANHPDQWPPMPVLAINIMLLLSLWQFAVLCRIFLQAAGAGVMVALMGMMFLVLMLQMGMS